LSGTLRTIHGNILATERIAHAASRVFTAMAAATHAAGWSPSTSGIEGADARAPVA
jgi:hypothetical protein